MKISKLYWASVILISLGMTSGVFCSITFIPTVTTAGYVRTFGGLFIPIFLMTVALGIASKALLRGMKKKTP